MAENREAIRTLLQAIGPLRESIAAQTIGATRWRALVEGTAPATRRINVSESGIVKAVQVERDVPYVTREEVEAIVRIATDFGAHIDDAAVSAALVESES